LETCTLSTSFGGQTDEISDWLSLRGLIKYYYVPAFRSSVLCLSFSLRVLRAFLTSFPSGLLAF
jgi:hypothetical protein